MYGRDGLCQISVYREEVLACYDGFVYDSSGAGHIASKLYSDGKAGIFEQLEIANYPGDFFPVWNSVADLYFSSIPDEWLEAARLDRANQLQIVRYIVVPAAKPAVVTLFVLTFVESWNMVEQPIIFLEGELDYPLSVFLAGVMENSMTVQSVCGLLCLLPVTFFFLYYHKELTDGLRDVLWS